MRLLAPAGISASAAGLAGPWPSMSNITSCLSGSWALAMNFIAVSLPPGLPLITASVPGEIRPWSQTNLILPPESCSISQARVDQISAIEASPFEQHRLAFGAAAPIGDDVRP